MAIHIDIFQHLHRLGDKDRRVTLADYERLGNEVSQKIARGIEEEAPKVQKALRRIADANTVVGRAKRDLAKIEDDQEKRDLRRQKINEQLLAQDERAIELGEKKLRILTRQDRQRDRSARIARDLEQREYALSGLRHDQAEGINEVRQSQLNLNEARKLGIFTAEDLSKEENRIRDLQRENAARQKEITDGTLEQARVKRELSRVNQRIERHEGNLAKTQTESRSVLKERNDLLKEETRLKEDSVRAGESELRSHEDVTRAIHNKRNALLSYRDALVDTDRKRGRGGNGGGEMNIVGRMLTDLPFVPGGKAGAIIGGGVITVLASVAEAVVTASQAMWLLPAAGVAAAAGVGTLAIGFSGLDQALKNMDDPKKFAEALQNISPAAQQVALEIKSLTDGPLKGLRNATQESLFANVPQMLHGVANQYGPEIQKLTTGVASAMNAGVGSIFNQLMNPKTQGSIDTIINNLVTAFHNLAPAMGPVVDAFVKITQVGSSFLPGMAQSLADMATKFADFITRAQASGDLARWINQGIEAAKMLGGLIVNIGKYIYNTFGGKSPEEFRRTIEATEKTLEGIISAIRGFAGILNDVVRILTPIAGIIGGWQNLIGAAAGAFVGFKAIGLATSTELAAGFTNAGTAAGVGFTGKFAAVLKGFGWAALGAAIAIPIINSIDKAIKSHKFDAAPDVYGGSSGTMTAEQWVNRAPVGTGEIQRRSDWLKTNRPDLVTMGPNGERPYGSQQFTPPWDAPNQPGSYQDFISGLPSQRPGYNGPHGTKGPASSTTWNMPDWSPQAVPPVPGDATSASDRRNALENQFANDPRFNVDPFGNIPGIPGISPSTGGPGTAAMGTPVGTPTSGMPQVYYRQENPYEPGEYGIYKPNTDAIGGDQEAIKKAAREWGDAQRNAAIVEQLRKENLASEDDLNQAKQAADDKQQAFIDARKKLNQDELGTWDKINQGTEKNLNNLQGVQQEIGAKIDQDFGFSKGLPGIFENLFKVIANMAMAPVIGALTGVTNVAGTAGPGTGLLGMLAPRKNMFGTLPGITGALPEGMVLGPDGYAVSADSSAANQPSYGPGPVGAPRLPGSVSANLPSGSAPGLPAGSTTGLPDPHGAKIQVSYLTALAERFGLKLISGKNDHVNDGLNHPKGLAGDLSNSSGNSPQQAAFAQFLNANFGDLLNELIYSDPNAPGVGISMGKPHTFSAGLNAQHENHIHASVSDANAPEFIQRAQAALGGQMPTSLYPGSSGATSSMAGGMPIPLPVTIVGFGGGGGGGLPGMPGLPGQTGAGPLPGPGQGGLSPEQWNLIMGAEAGGSGGWSANTGNGYSGGLQFTPSTWNAYKPAGAPAQAWQATPEQQMAAGNATLAAQGPGAWPATSAAHPDWFKPGSTPGGAAGAAPNASAGPGTSYMPGVPGGGGSGSLPGLPGSMAQPPGAAPFTLGATGTFFTPDRGRTYGEGQTPSAGFGISGGVLGAAAGAAGGAANMMAPGAGAGAQIGIDEINRAISFGAQAVGIGVQGLMETFLPVESELADPSRGWFGRILGGVAGVSAVAPNIAGALSQSMNPKDPNQPPLTPEQVAAQKAKDGQPAQPGQPGQPPVNVNVNNTKVPDIQTDVSQQQQQQYSMPGSR